MPENKLNILVARHGRPSQKKVFEKTENSELIIRSAIFEGFVHRKNPENLKLRKKVKNLNLKIDSGILIRWGCTSNADTSNCIVYNKANAIKLANDKLAARKALEAANIAIPKTYSFSDIQSNSSNVVWPVIGRPKQHGQGKEFHICNNIQEVQNSRNNKNCVYWSEVYHKTREFRVHCMHGKIASILQKPSPTNPESHAWNFHQQHLAFQNIPHSDWKNYICKTALAAVEALGLNWGGVDVMVCDNYQELNVPRIVVCEVNTAPTLTSSEFTMSKYLKYFEWLRRQPTRREHWDWKSYTSPKSHAWLESHFEN